VHGRTSVVSGGAFLFPCGLQGRSINYQTSYGPDDEADVEARGAYEDDPFDAEHPPADQGFEPKRGSTTNPFADFSMHDNPLATPTHEAQGGSSPPPPGARYGGTASEPPMKPLTEFSEEEVCIRPFPPPCV
jgi:hypothetical protein